MYSNLCDVFSPDFEAVFGNTVGESKSAGSSFVFVAPTVTCNPKPAYTWKKDGVKLVENGRISISRDDSKSVGEKFHTLYIADLAFADQGRYECEVQNPVLAQQGKPNAKQIIKTIQLSIGGTYLCLQWLLCLKAKQEMSTTARLGYFSFSATQKNMLRISGQILQN